MDPEDPPSLWLFNSTESTLFILRSPNPATIKLSTRAFLDCSLIDLHEAYWSGNSNDLLRIKERSKLQNYHARLRSLVERDLLHEHERSKNALNTPRVLLPWIQRTVWLYGHDEHGRKSFQEANHPDLTKHKGEHKSNLD